MNHFVNSMDVLSNPGTVFARRLVLVEHMIGVDNVAARKALGEATGMYHVEVQGYIAALWREICALREELILRKAAELNLSDAEILSASEALDQLEGKEN